MAAEKPVIFIVGPTASGKTTLAIDLAHRFGGEIICADSRTIYKDMDIGTAKPTANEQARVVHWGLDLVEPGERFTAADFKQYAHKKINEIKQRGNIPIVVGGSGLYVNAVLYNFTFNESFDYPLREKFSNFTTHELIEYCNKNNIIVPENRHNKRYLVRSIEKNNTQENDTILMKNAVVVGIAPESKDSHTALITQRVEHMLENGVVDEAIMLGNKYGWESEAMTGNIYRFVREYVDNHISKDELLQRAIISDRQLAKRQMTWFKRDSNIRWLTVSDAKVYCASILSEH